jgi:hypothetical protein
MGSLDMGLRIVRAAARTYIRSTPGLLGGCVRLVDHSFKERGGFA